MGINQESEIKNSKNGEVMTFNQRYGITKKDIEELAGILLRPGKLHEPEEFYDRPLPRITDGGTIENSKK